MNSEKQECYLSNDHVGKWGIRDKTRYREQRLKDIIIPDTVSVLGTVCDVSLSINNWENVSIFGE